MVWYYKVGEQEKGPISKAELQSLIKSKKLGAHSLVRNEKMDQWKPLVELVQKKAPASPPPVPSSAAVDGDASTCVCSQCARSFPEDQMIVFDDKRICAACKPLFVQELKEGAISKDSQIYAGFWVRVLAKTLDGILMIISQWVIMIPLGIMIMPSINEGSDPFSDNSFIFYMGIQLLLGILVPLFYNTYFIGKWSATLGKMTCGLRVVTPEGDKITYLRAFGRFFAEGISMIILYIGYVMVAFDDEKRALHDRICSTRVVKKN